MGHISIRIALFLTALVLTSACNEDGGTNTEGLSVQDQVSSGGSSGSSGGSSSGSSSSSGTGGNSYTCSLTLSINGGTPSQGTNALAANVGDRGDFLVTSNTGSNRFHWYGTKDGAPDWDKTETDPRAYGGPFQDVAGGHIYTRYVIVEAANGSALCDTRKANGMKPMTVSIAPGPTCSLTLSLNGGAASTGGAAITANVGDQASFLVSTNTSGLRYHWYGTRDGVVDADVVVTDPKAFTGPFLPDSGGHTYTRYVVLEKLGYQNAIVPVCNTKTANGGKPMTVAINAGPTCSLTLAVGAGAASMGLTPISTNIRTWGTFKANRNVIGAKVHWHGTRDGVTDMDLINNDLNAYVGPFPDDSAGAYTRYVTIEAPQSGALLCDSRTANGNQPLRVNISSAPGCSQSVSMNPIDTSGGPVNVDWSFTSVVPGTRVFFNGTKNGAVDANDTLFVSDFTGTSYTAHLRYDSSMVGTYTRTAVLKDAASGAPVCRTNEIDVIVK